MHETEGRASQLTRRNKARQWEMERGSSGQGVRLPMEARRCRMETVNTQTEKQCGENRGEQRWRGKENRRKLWRGTEWVWRGRSEMCQSSGILKEGEKKRNVTTMKTLGYRLVSEKRWLKNKGLPKCEWNYRQTVWPWLRADDVMRWCLGDRRYIKTCC